MNITRKLIAAIATASMLVTSFVSFATVASASEKPTVTAELISIEELQTLDTKAKENNSVGVKISFANFRTSLRSMVFNLNLSSNIKGQSNSGGAATLSAANVSNAKIMKVPYTEEEIEYDWDDPCYPIQGGMGWSTFGLYDDVGDGYKRLNMIWVNWDDTEGSGVSAIYFNPNEQYFVISLRKTTDYEIENGDIVITKANMQLGYSDVGPVMTQDEFEVVDLINTSTDPDPDPVVTEVTGANTTPVDKTDSLYKWVKWTVTVPASMTGNGVTATLINETEKAVEGATDYSLDTTIAADQFNGFGEADVELDVWAMIKEAVEDTYSLVIKAIEATE